MERILSLPQIVQRTEEWYERRNNLLTASDVATALGINPYESRNSLMKKKKEKPSGSGGSIATRHGNDNEDIARHLFGNLYNLETQEVGLFVHPVIDWLGGSPDGVVSDGSLLEIKCPLTRKIEHKIPDYYYPQVQICMEVLNVEQCYFVQFKPETTFSAGELDVLVVKRSKEWFNENLPLLQKFWDDLKTYTYVPRKMNRKPKAIPECYIVDDDLI